MYTITMGKDKNLASITGDWTVNTTPAGAPYEVVKISGSGTANAELSSGKLKLTMADTETLKFAIKIAGSSDGVADPSKDNYYIFDLQGKSYEVLVDAETPTFDTNITTDAGTATIGTDGVDLTVAASVDDGGAITYQWYVATTSTGDGTPISGETEAALSLTKEEVGTVLEISALAERWFYCIATNTNEDDAITGATTATAKSNVKKITFSTSV
jgi:hypothetical protein